MRQLKSQLILMSDKSYEDLEGEIEELLVKFRAKWRLNALAWLDYDDICQVIRIHIHKKLHLWDQSRAFKPWCASLINRQIINEVRNNYGNYAKPCLKCPHYAGGKDCHETVSGVQDVSCGDFAKWKKKKEVAYNVKLPLSLDTSISCGGHVDRREVDYDSKVGKVHELIMGKLSGHHRDIYRMLYIEFKSDEEVASVFGFKEDSSKRKTPRYKQVNNLKKRFYELGKEVLKDNDLID